MRLTRRQLTQTSSLALLATLLPAATRQAATPVATLLASTGQASSLVNVRDYGAKGDGSTDDSAAIKAAVDAILASRVFVAEAKTAQQTLFFPAGVYRITQADTLVWSPTGGTADQIHGFRMQGMGPRATEIFFDTDFTPSNDPRKNNLLTAANRLRYSTFSDMSFRSQNPANNWGYFWSVHRVDRTSLYPAYGWGQNQHQAFENVEWRGTWNRVVGVDGDGNANNNSEWMFSRCDTDVNFVAVDAFLHVGITDPSRNSQQDQFLNWFFDRCNFALANGTLMKFDRGGNITIRDGSWSFVGTKPGIYLSFPRSVDHSAAHLLVEGVRFEPKASDGSQKIIDCRWGIGSVTFRNCSDIGSTQHPNFASTPLHSYCHVNGWLPVIRYVDCKLAGVHEFDCSGANPTTRGRAVYDGCFMYHQTRPSEFLTVTASGGQPRYRTLNCWTMSDSEN